MLTPDVAGMPNPALNPTTQQRPLSAVGFPPQLRCSGGRLAPRWAIGGLFNEKEDRNERSDN